MPDVISHLRDAGFSDQEITAWSTDKRQALAAGGFNDAEIDDYFGAPKTPDTVPMPLLDRIAKGIKFARDVVETPMNVVGGEIANAQIENVQGAIKNLLPKSLGGGREPAAERSDKDTEFGGMGPTAAGLMYALGSFPPFAAAQGAIQAVIGHPLVATDEALRGGAVKLFGEDKVAEAERAAGEHAGGGSVGGMTLEEGRGISNRAMMTMGPNPLTRIGFGAMGEAETVAIGGLPKGEDFSTAGRVIGNGDTTPAMEQKLSDLYEQKGVHPAEVAHDAQSDPTITQSILSSDPKDMPESYGPPLRPPEPPAPAGGQPPPYSDAEKHILSKISIGEQAPTRALTWNGLYTNFIDKLFPISKAVKDVGADLTAENNPYQLARLLSGYVGKADHFLNNGTFDFTTYESNGASLKEILNPVKDLNGFRAYATAQRALELESRGIKSGFAEEAAAPPLVSTGLDAARTVVKDGAEKYQQPFRALVDYQNRVSEYLRDSGVLSDAGYKAMVEANKMYVPFSRVIGIDADAPHVGGSSLQARNPIKAIKGSARDIIDPIESVVRNTYHMIEMAEKNVVGTKLVDMLKRAGGGLPEAPPAAQLVVSERGPLEGGPDAALDPTLERVRAMGSPMDIADRAAKDPEAVHNQIDEIVTGIRQAERELRRRHGVKKTEDLEDAPLNKKESDFLFYGKDHTDVEWWRDLQKQLQPVENLGEAAQEIAYELKRLPKDPANLSGGDEMVVVRLQTLFSEVHRLGGDLGAVIKEAGARYGARFNDPEDAEFMVQGAAERLRAMFEQQKAQLALPPPAIAKPDTPHTAAVSDALAETGIKNSDELAASLAHASAPVREGEIAILRDGKRETYKVDPDLARAMKGLDQQSMGALEKILSYPASLLRAGAVMTPDFAIRHTIRDFLYATTTFKGGVFTPIDMARGFAGLMMKDADYWNWLKGGGGNISLVGIDRRYMQEDLRKLTGQTGLVGRAWNVLADPEASMWEKGGAVAKLPFQAIGKFVLDPLRAATQFAENASHLGAFKKSMRTQERAGPTNLRSQIIESAWASRDTAVDAARMGANMRAYNMITAFANIKLQDTDRVVRALKDNPLGTITKIGGAITVPSVLLWAANHDDPRYAEIPQWEKDLFFVVMTPDHIFRIPKPWAMGQVFGTMPERLLDAFVAERPDAFKEFFKDLWATSGPDFIPTAAAPIVDQFANRSTFTNRTLIPSEQEKFLPEYQYTPYTTELTKSLGRIIGAFPGMTELKMDNSGFGGTARALTSPILMENYIRGWSGTLGVYALNAADAALRKAGVLPDPPQPASTLADIPVIKAFTIRYPSASAESIQDFYDTYDRNKAYFDTWMAKAKDGDLAATQHIQEMGGPMMFAQLDGIKSALAAHNKLIRDIYKNPDAPPDEKRQLIDQLYFSMIQVARAGNQAFRQIKDAATVRGALLPTPGLPEPATAP